jgi:hypothetical protein
MSALVEVLYPMPDTRRTAPSIVHWWESRRLLYNGVVGTTGLFTLAAVLLLVPPGSGMEPQGLVLFTLAYGVMANVCYSAGWVLELLARWAWGSGAPRVGPFLFREGLIFSVGLTLLPVLPALVYRVVRTAMWIF